MARPRRSSLTPAQRRATLAEALGPLRARGDEPQDFPSWAALVPEPKTGALDFARFPYQRELYESGVDDREIVVMKSTQVGVSSHMFRWALFQADVRGRTGVYVFPTRRDMDSFTSGRVQRVIEHSDYLRMRRRPRDPSSRDLITIGKGQLYFRGSEAQRGLDSIDADLLIFDEYDTLNHENIPDAERRVSGPLSAGLIRRVGVPSTPGWGISSLYDASDQRRWRVKCRACGEDQAITFEENIDTDRGLRVCRRCRKELDVASGLWVADFPSRDVRGYHVTRLIAPDADVPAIIAASRRTTRAERHVFRTKDLGLPDEEPGARLSRSVIERAQDLGGGYLMPHSYTGDNVVTMGVDVASARDLNVRVSERLSDAVKRCLFVGTVPDFEDLDVLMRRYGVHMAAVDHAPEGRLALGLVARFPGRAYRVSYNTTTAPNGTEGPSISEEDRLFTVPRTGALDEVMAMLRDGRNVLPRDLPADYFKHLQAPLRVTEMTQNGRQRVFYRSSGPDDYAHAEAYDDAAFLVLLTLEMVRQLEEETYSTLDDHLYFPRSRLADYDTPVIYEPGAQRFDGAYGVAIDDRGYWD